MKFYQTWQGALLASSDVNDIIKSFPAEVPGNLQYDLAVAEGIADTLMYSTTAQRFLEVEDNFWKYETKLDYKVEAGERAIFVAEGIDYIFDIIIKNTLKVVEKCGKPIPFFIMTSERNNDETIEFFEGMM